jgi:Xaa-Pro dipeptidase
MVISAGCVSAALARAQARAAALFAEVQRRELIRAAQSESSISQAIHALALAQFGVGKHWHRRVIRSGPNTRLPFSVQTPDRTVEQDDIVSIDLGPVFDDYEADFGRSYVIGQNPEMLALRDDLATLFRSCRDFYWRRPDMTGAVLYEHVVRACAERGWGFAGAHAGHLIGPFVMPREQRDAAVNRIRPDNDQPMNALDSHGQPRDWILEIHLLDPTGAFGGFFEDRLA